MAKDEINRATRAEAGDVVGAPKQQDVAELLKKMKVVAEADAKAAHTPASDEQAASAEQTDAQNQAQSADAQADASQMVASVDSIFATDAAPVEVAMLDGGSVGGGGGVSTGTLLAIGGVALVGGGIAIAANNDSGGGGGSKSVPTAVTAGAASVNEGSSVNFTVTGTPDATVSWSVDATHTGDVTVQSGSIKLDSNGNGVITITTVADNATEGAETLTLTVDGATASVTINDTSTLPPAEDVNLTTLTDTVDLSGKAGASVVTGVAAGGNAFNETFSVGDKVTGNGSTILDLKVADGGTEAVVQLDNFAAINLVNLAGNTSATFDATLWTDVSSVNLVDGQDGLRANVIDLERDVDLSVASGVSGSIAVSYTDHLQVAIGAEHDSEIAYVANNVDATVTDNESAFFSMNYTDQNNPLDVTLGNVTAVVGDDNASFSLLVSSTGGDGDITVGDVEITAGTNASIAVTVGSTVAAPGAYNVAVGDVSIAGDSGATANVALGLSNALAGDVVVGDVSITDFASIDLFVGRTNATASAPAGDVTVGDVTLSVTSDLSGTIANTGDLAVGDLTVGDVSVSVAQSANSGNDLDIRAQAQAAGSDDASVGNITVGNVALSLETSATASVTISATAGAVSGNSVIGNVTVGNIVIDAAVNADGHAQVYASATSVNGTGSIGDYTVGDVSVTLNDAAAATVYLSAYADGGGSLGDVTLGNILVDSANGVGASANLDLTFSASSSGSIGNVTVGDVTLVAGESASYTLDLQATAGTVGDVTIGDITATLLKNAFVDFSDYNGSTGVFLSATTGNLGDVSVGNVVIDAATSATGWLSFDINAAENIGAITFGDVSLTAAESASAYFGLYATAGFDVGDITFGDVSVVAEGFSAFAGFSVSATGPSDMGDITLGNVAISAEGEDAASYFFLQTATAGAGGSIVAGDVDLTVKSGADDVSATVTLTVNSTADISIGDIAVHLDAYGTSTSTLDDIGANNITGNFINAVGDITTGVISVDGGDGLKDNLFDFTNLLSVFSAGGDITIEGVDYSGYLGETVTTNIDVSGVKGAGTIIGSDFDDLITGNVTKNVMTGGDGNDVFTFLSNNTGLTAATMDEITDWVKDDDQLDVGILANAGTNYAELSGNFASIADFLAAANAAAGSNNALDIIVGVSGGSLYVAVDSGGPNDQMDYMVKLTGINTINGIDQNDFV